MSDETSVNAAAMQTGINDLKVAYQKLREALDSLTTELNKSLAAWEGSARETYTDCQRRWNEACEHMVAVITKMESVLGTITQGYGDTEKAISGRFGGL